MWSCQCPAAEDAGFQSLDRKRLQSWGLQTAPGQARGEREQGGTGAPDRQRPCKSSKPAVTNFKVHPVKEEEREN